MSALPALFISHGAPTFATEPGLAGAQLRALGIALGKPRAVVVVSPHWMSSGVEITATYKPQTIHDFGGFPRALYDLQYPAPGSPELAAVLEQQLICHGIDAKLNQWRGLDHGAWVPLLHLFPEADVPVLQVSLPIDADEYKAIALGQALAPLSDHGVLVVGSGSLTHNLYEFREGVVESAQYVQQFSAWVRQTILAADLNRLAQSLTLAPHAARAHPTKEHFLPLLVAAGAASDLNQVTVLNGGVRHGVLAMESYVLGRHLVLEALPHAELNRCCWRKLCSPETL